MSSASDESASYTETLQELLDGLDPSELSAEYPGDLTICAPHWVVERIGDETGRLSHCRCGVVTVTTDTISVTALSALEQPGGLGYVAVVDVVGGRCVDMSACHIDVAPGRWMALTLALAHGLDPAAAVAVERLGLECDET